MKVKKSKIVLKYTKSTVLCWEITFYKMSLKEDHGKDNEILKSELCNVEK